MATHKLAVFDDGLLAGSHLSLGYANRVLYVFSGDVEVTSDAKTAALAENQAWHGAGVCTISARSDARIWRWEIRRATGVAAAEREATAGIPKLECGVDLAPGDYLMRCDRVDFPPGGIAYTHTHQGPGIRVLLRGRFRVETGGHTLSIGPGEPWFERGPDPVYAEASTEEPAGFIRVMVLPRALLGKSSIRYVRPEDQDRPKTQTYTVFLDRPIEP
jgi:quercetin dioxygenase-like cupin family protein